MDKIRAVIAAVVTVATSAALLGAAPLNVPAPGPAAAPAAGAAQAPWPLGTVRTVGKLVGTYADGQLLTCSGAVVDAPNGSVVVTAAHCVHNPGEPRWQQAWFVPAYHRHGTANAARVGWRVTSAHLEDAWRNGRLPQALPYDYAFLTVERKDGRTIQERVGANRIDFEPVDPAKPTVALGYPATRPYDGEALAHCAGTPTLLTGRDTQQPNVGGLLLQSCDLTQGSSGGPWLQDYDAASQSGTVVAVMSVGDDRGRVLGRPLPDGARRLLEAAGGVLGD
ncbi:MAG TPA: trypsin-like peptidase domain-containing protein [Streptomyces sp.]|uniref:trypsin-like serine peptidase n=1 Tax=Streptomyces sp. TaxID=1931 RepID=UPI002D3B454B|nr:trypsin-like peptidase domain-containing protein [Streptomyces sp.]HZG03973.1 trypsin-like peptidase domain-containing protein [Streptomyces sp.]